MYILLRFGHPKGLVWNVRNGTEGMRKTWTNRRQDKPKQNKSQHSASCSSQNNHVLPATIRIDTPKRRHICTILNYIASQEVPVARLKAIPGQSLRSYEQSQGTLRTSGVQFSLSHANETRYLLKFETIYFD